MQGAWYIPWYCGSDVIYADQEESRRYYTTLGNTPSKLDLSTDHPVCRHSCCLLNRKSLSHLCILPCTPARRSFSSSPSVQTCQRPLTGQRKPPEPSFSLGWHLQYPASREPVGLWCFETVDSLSVLELELSLTQNAKWAFCWWSSPEAFQHSWSD